MNTFENSTLEKFKKILSNKNYSIRTIEMYSHYTLKFLEKNNKYLQHLTSYKLALNRLYFIHIVRRMCFKSNYYDT
jgi:hypothetical protein